VRLAALFARLGVRKVRLTGGEPLLRKDLASIVRRIRALPGVREVCLTTNGHLLAEAARALKDAGLDRINLSVDTLDPEKFPRGHRRPRRRRQAGRGRAGPPRTRASPTCASTTVVVDGFNDGEAAAIVRWPGARRRAALHRADALRRRRPPGLDPGPHRAQCGPRAWR
jgi:cyclic pyranopterin phosphate synthase